jgi:hypothetical protein
MDRYYKFAIVRFAPDELRGEQLNIGVAVLGDSYFEVRSTRRLDRVRSISGALDLNSLSALLKNLSSIDADNREAGKLTIEQRLAELGKVGPLKLSEPGTFRSSDPKTLQDRITSILKRYVEPEPTLSRPRPKKSRVLTEVRSMLKKQRVLAQKHEDLDSHRIVPNFELDEGLTADFVLRNGAFHVVETVDVLGDQSAYKKAVADIAVSALVLERARMRFGEEATKGRIVYSAPAAMERVAQPSLEAAAHQGAELINWASETDRMRFIQGLAILAVPLDKKRKQRFFVRHPGDLFDS